MIKSAINYPASQVFDIEAAGGCAVSRYQREYTRSTVQWEALFDDVKENDPECFPASIICINQTTDTLAVQRLGVVDWINEYIFPQGENIPTSWFSMVVDGDAKKGRVTQQTHFHKLGNLTPSAFNSTLGDKSFKEKPDRTNSKSREVGYKNGLKVNAELATVAGWSVAQINAPTTILANQVASLFAMTGGRPCA